MKYMHGVETGADVTTFYECLTPDQVCIEKIMLGIRQARGLDLEDVLQGASVVQRQHVYTQVQQLQEGGFLREHEGRLVLTTKGLSLENQIALQLAC